MPSKEDLDFIKKVVSLNLITQEQLELCLKLQKYFENEKKVVSLSSIMVEKKFILPSQVQTIHQTTFELHKKFARYEILKELGQGGMGKVYKAFDSSLSRILAIKVLLDGETSDRRLTRFMQEAKIMANLDHPNIIKIFDIGREQGKPFFAMEYIEGHTLEAKINKSTPIQEQLETIVVIAKAVAYLHSKGIVHRDLKPANVMISKGNDIKVMDFGLAKIDMDQKISQDGAMIGTLAYMAPEQYESKDVDARSDVYALGIMLYEMLTTKLPFSGTALNIFSNKLYERPVSPSSINKKIVSDIDTICFKAIEPQKRDRYKTAETFYEDIQRVLKGENILARPLNPLQKLWRNIKKNLLVVSLVSVIIAICIGVFGYQKVKQYQRQQLLQQLEQIEKEMLQIDLNKESAFLNAIVKVKKLFAEHKNNISGLSEQVKSLLTKFYQFQLKKLQKVTTLSSKEKYLKNIIAKLQILQRQLENVEELSNHSKFLVTSALNKLERYRQNQLENIEVYLKNYRVDRAKVLIYIDYLSKLLKEKITTSHLLLLRAKAYQHLMAYDKAYLDYQQLLKMNVKKLEVQTGVGICAFYIKKYDKVQKHLEPVFLNSATQIKDKELAKIIVILLDTAFATKQWHKISFFFKKASKKRTWDKEVFFTVAKRVFTIAQKTLQQGLYPQSQKLFQALENWFPQESIYFIMVASFYIYSNTKIPKHIQKRFVGVFTMIYQQNIQYRDAASLFLGHLYLQKRDFERSKRYIQKLQSKKYTLERYLKKYPECRKVLKSKKLQKIFD